MRLSLHTVLCCCCVFTTVLPQVQGAPGEPNTSLKKRFREWLQSHMKKDLRNNVVASNEPSSDIHVGPEQDSQATSVSPPTSFRSNLRRKRSITKQSGCALVTCLTHDLVDRLAQLNSKTGVCAPAEKMGSDGYGRRRRRSPPVITPQPGKPKCNTEDGSQHVNKHKKKAA